MVTKKSSAKTPTKKTSAKKTPAAKKKPAAKTPVKKPPAKKTQPKTAGNETPILGTIRIDNGVAKAVIKGVTYTLEDLKGLGDVAAVHIDLKKLSAEQLAKLESCLGSVEQTDGVAQAMTAEAVTTGGG